MHEGYDPSADSAYIHAAQDARVAALFSFARHLLNNGPPNNDADNDDDDDDEMGEEEEEEEEAEDDEQDDAEDGVEEDDNGHENEEEGMDDGNEEMNLLEAGEEENREDDPVLEVTAEEPSKDAEPKNPEGMRRLRSKSCSFSDLQSPEHDRQYQHPDEKKVWVPESDCVIVSETAGLAARASQRQHLANLLKQIEEQKPLESKLQHDWRWPCAYKINMHDAVHCS